MVTKEGRGVKANGDKRGQGGEGVKIGIFTGTYFLNGPIIVFNVCVCYISLGDIYSNCDIF